jgi:signal transduction histidine kinase
MSEPAEGRDLQQAKAGTEAVGALDEFALIAHEIRGPLSVLLGQMELARELLEREGDHDMNLIRRAFDQGYDGARRLSALTAQLIEARHLSGGFALNEVVDLNDVMQSVAEALPPTAARRLSLELSEVPALVTGHRLYLSRVAANLLDNALKYSPPGGEIKVATASRDDRVVALTITDAGVGITDEEIERVRGEFQRGSGVAVQRTPGSGLGLYIVEEIVRRHGGGLQVRSTEGKGTKITVVLPRAA